MKEKTLYTLLYDTKLRKPGCVLLQAVAGGDNHFLHRMFTSQDWLVTPTDDMVMVNATEVQWEAEIALTQRREVCGNTV